MDKFGLDRAFSALSESVSELSRQGRRPVGAALKIELARRIGGFDERAFGYRGFGEFLRAAENLGLVRLEQTSSDIEVSPGSPGAANLDRRVTATSERPARSVRRDLWRAFVDFTPNVVRVLDRESGRAWMLTPEPSPYESPNLQNLRAAMGTEPSRFAQIQPISVSMQVRWRQEFISALPVGAVTKRLTNALTSARPLRAFSQVLHDDPELFSLWTDFRLPLVVNYISEWMQQNGVKTPIFASEADMAFVPTKSPPAAPAPLVSVRRKIDVEGLRVVLHRAIDRMPLEELLLIRLPAGYMMDA